MRPFRQFDIPSYTVFLATLQAAPWLTADAHPEDHALIFLANAPPLPSSWFAQPPNVELKQPRNPVEHQKNQPIHHQTNSRSPPLAPFVLKKLEGRPLSTAVLCLVFPSACLNLSNMKSIIQLYVAEDKAGEWIACWTRRDITRDKV